MKRSAGANIIVKACDVADAENMTRVVDECAQRLSPIAGVVHSGMVPQK